MMQPARHRAILVSPNITHRENEKYVRIHSEEAKQSIMNEWKKGQPSMAVLSHTPYCVAPQKQRKAFNFTTTCFESDSNKRKRGVYQQEECEK